MRAVDQPAKVFCKPLAGLGVNQAKIARQTLGIQGLVYGYDDKEPFFSRFERCGGAIVLKKSCGLD